MPAGQIDFREICGRFLAKIGIFKSNRVINRSKKNPVQDNVDKRTHKTITRHELLSCFVLCLLPALILSSRATFTSAVHTPFSDQPLKSISYDTTMPTAFDSSSLSTENMARQVILCFSANAMLTLITIANGVFSFWRLTLSGDIESNPGPGAEECVDIGQQVQDALRDFERTLVNKIESAIQKQVCEILQAIQVQREALETIQDTQIGMQEKLSTLCHDLDKTNKIVGKNSEKIKELRNVHDETNTTVSDLCDQIDRIEGYSRRNNVKFYGIPESDRPESNTDCSEAVKLVLKTYMPNEKWSDDVIDRAHRLGGRQSSQNTRPRPIIAKFLRWSDAMCLMKNKEARADMKKENLTVAQDLTRRQSSTLKELRDEGKSGYFVNGKLHIRNNDQRPTAPQLHSPGRKRQASPAMIYTSPPGDRPQRPRSTESNRKGNPADGETRESRDNSASPPPISAGRDDTSQRLTPATHRPNDSGQSSADSRGPRSRTRAAAANGERQAKLQEAWGTKNSRQEKSRSNKR